MLIVRLCCYADLRQYQFDILIACQLISLYMGSGTLVVRPSSVIRPCSSFWSFASFSLEALAVTTLYCRKIGEVQGDMVFSQISIFLSWNLLWLYSVQAC